VMLWAVSRAPLAKLQAYQRRMGWTFPWASSSSTRLQRRLQRPVHRGATARGDRIQLPARGGRGSRARGRRRERLRGMSGTDEATYCASGPASAHSRSRTASSTTRIQPMRAAWTALGHVPVARPRPRGRNETGRLVAPPRRVRAEVERPPVPRW
jgi:predicted dithiol-disulfide oxidoreductase (DUF899 family)